MNEFLRRHLILVIGFGALMMVLISAVGAYTFLRLYHSGAKYIPQAQSRVLTSFTENGVTVDIVFEQDASQAWLVGVFTPTQEHFHMYSKDLPLNGLDGQGRPTRLEIISGPVKAHGEVTANQPTYGHFTHAIEKAVPIYPEGPVSLRMPITLSGSPTALPTQLSLTFQTCSEITCLVPVIDKRVEVMIPGVATE